MNLHQLKLLQVALFFTLLIIYHKCRNDLNIYKKNELESTFIEIVNPKKSLWESYTDTYPWIILTLIAIT